MVTGTRPRTAPVKKPPRSLGQRQTPGGVRTTVGPPGGRGRQRPGGSEHRPPHGHRRYQPGPRPRGPRGSTRQQEPRRDPRKGLLRGQGAHEYHRGSGAREGNPLRTPPDGRRLPARRTGQSRGRTTHGGLAGVSCTRAPTGKRPKTRLWPCMRDGPALRCLVGLFVFSLLFL